MLHPSLFELGVGREGSAALPGRLASTSDSRGQQFRIIIRFGKSMVTLGAALLEPSPSAAQLAEQSTVTEPRRIDVHHHIAPLS